MLTHDDLVGDMAQGCKARPSFRIGIELEQFMFNRKTGVPLPYEDSSGAGIRDVLEGLAAFGWQREYLNNHLIALSRDGQAVSLEPGGQVEFASSPLPTTDAVKAQLGQFMTELHSVADRLGLGILAAGFPPEWRREDMHWMPKERYKIMREYMPRVGEHGLDMMLRTAGTQINLDFSSEADMIRKIRVAMGVQPVMIALLANSRMVEGYDSGYVSYRSHMWTKTDPARCGVPEFIFKEGMGFSRYVDYALDAPMYFIYRDGRYMDASGLSFRDFMRGTLPGHAGVYATMDDWHQHLTTLFPEVRLKHYLELRGPDSAPIPLVHAMTAFWTGLLYEEGALESALSLIADTPPEDHNRLRADVAKMGLDARLHNGRSLRALATDALEIADSGLSHIPAEVGARADLAPFFEQFKKAA